MNWFVNASLQYFEVHMYVYYFYLLKKIRKMLTICSSSCFSDINIQQRMVSSPALKSHTCQCPEWGVGGARATEASPSPLLRHRCVPRRSQALLWFGLSDFLTLLLAIT